MSMQPDSGSAGGSAFGSPSIRQLLDDISYKLQSGVYEEQEEAGDSLIELLKQDNPQVPEIITTTGVVPRLLQMLSWEHSPIVMYNSLCALSDLALGASVVLQDHRFIPALVNFLSCEDDGFVNQTIVALGNLARDSASNRDLILNHGALSPLISEHLPFERFTILKKRLFMLRPASWCLSNFLRGQPSVDLEKVRLALPVLRRLVHFKDEEVLENICWALCYIVEGPDNSVQAVIRLGVCPKLVKLLHHSSGKVTLPALKALGHIAAGDVVRTQVVLDSRVLPSLRILLLNEYRERIFREICCIITNITDGTPSQLQAVVDADVVPFMVNLLPIANLEVKMLVVRVIGNVFAKGTKENAMYLADRGCITRLLELSANPDPNLVLMCLEELKNFLKMGEDGQSKKNDFVAKIKEGGTLNKMIGLMVSKNKDIKTLAWKVSKRVWCDSDLD